MNPASNDLQDVIDSGMCIACGACVAADPTLSLVLDHDRLMYRPSHASGSAAATVCPAIAVDFPGLQAALFPGEVPGALGVVKSMVLAQSRDVDRNAASSSGGIIKELLLDLLRVPGVDGAICLAHQDGLNFGARLVRSEAEIEALPGSIYHSVPFDDAIGILERTPGRFVVVAIPCQLEGLYTFLTKARPDLRSRVYLTIGLICGWTYSHHAIHALARYRGFEHNEISSISYRGGEAVGQLGITLKGDEVRLNRRLSLDYLVAFDRSFNVPRCHLCVNHINVLADLVVGDAWLSRTSATRTGISIVICRTNFAVDAIARLERADRIRTAPADERDIVESQSRRFTYGDLAYAYGDFRHTKGLHTPRMTGPNRNAAALEPGAVVASLHATLTRKTGWQMARRYRLLWWDKLLREGPRLLWRALRRLVRRLGHRPRRPEPHARLPEGFL